MDYRALNENTVADKYPLSLISDQTVTLHEANYISCLDMTSGFYKIPLPPDSVKSTAFITLEGQYEIMTMPFG